MHRTSTPATDTSATVNSGIRRPALGVATALGLLGAIGLTTPAGASAPTEPAAPLPAEVCDSLVTIGGALLGDPNTAAPAIATLVAQAPDELAPAVATLVESFSAAPADPDALGTPEFTAAWSELGLAAFDGCETDLAVDVAGVDYAFGGLPAELPAGRVAIRLTNATESGQPHELVLVRRIDEDGPAAHDLLMLPPEELFTHIAMTAFAFAEQPDDQSVMLVDLEPGSYLAVCMLPTEGDEADPHAMHGMVQEIEVGVMSLTLRSPSPSPTSPTSPTSPSPTGARPATPWWAGAGAVAGLLGIAMFVVTGAVDVSDQDVLADNSLLVADLDGAQWAVFAFQVLGVAAAAALAVFAAGLRRRLAAQEPAGSLVPAVATIGLGLTAAMCLAGSGICTELFWNLHNADRTDPDTIAANLAVFNTLAWVWAGAGLTTGAVALAARRGSEARWLGRTSAVATVLIAATQVTPFQYLALVPAALWLVAAGGGLWRAERRRPEPTPTL